MGQSKAETVLDIDGIGRAFVGAYFEAMSAKDRSKMAAYYRDMSCLSYEGQGFQGVKAIINKLRALPIESIAYDIKTLDVQPSGCGGLMLFVTGDVMLNAIPNPVKFAQSLHIVPEEASQDRFWIHNDIF